MTSVLCCGSYRNCEYSIKRHLDSLEKNIISRYNTDSMGYINKKDPFFKVDVDWYLITHNNRDSTERHLIEFVTKVGGELERLDSDIRMKSDNHDWTTEQILYLSQLRDKCLERGKDYDYVWMNDGDVELHPKTLQRQMELSGGEHVVHTTVLHTHDRWGKSKAPCYVNYQTEMAKNGTDEYTGKHLTFEEIVKDFKEGVPKEVKVSYMCWLIPKKVLKYVSFYEKGVYEFDFKVFSKKCRDNNIKQIVDFKYPAMHLEKSNIILKYCGE